MKLSPREIGKDIADAGALLHESDEYNAIVSVAARAIRAERAERKGTIILTKAEAEAALGAIGQMTDGNARDYDEWKSQTHGTRNQWKALLRAEAKIASVLGVGK